MKDQVRAADSGKEKNSALVPSFPFSIFISAVEFRVIVITTYLQFYHVSNSLFRCTYIHTNHDNAGNTPADPLAGILLLPIATLLSFYVKQVQHINLHLS
ncbi:hypothetical protein V3595_04705 [Bacillus sp. CFBP9009]